jgi:hypothetical protein
MSPLASDYSITVTGRSRVRASWGKHRKLMNNVAKIHSRRYGVGIDYATASIYCLVLIEAKR